MKIEENKKKTRMTKIIPDIILFFMVIHFALSFLPFLRSHALRLNIFFFYSKYDLDRNMFFRQYTSRRIRIAFHAIFVSKKRRSNINYDIEGLKQNLEGDTDVFPIKDKGSDINRELRGDREIVDMKGNASLGMNYVIKTGEQFSIHRNNSNKVHTIGSEEENKEFKTEVEQRKKKTGLIIEARAKMNLLPSIEEVPEE